MKSKRNLIQVCMLCAAMRPVVAQAQFTFTTNNNAITITGYTGTNVEVTIPSTTNGFPVTSIRYMAFYGSSLISVAIPESVTTIEGHAFDSCGKLASVTIPTSVTNVATTAFAGCSSMIAILVDSLNSYYSSLNGVLFDKSQRTLVEYPGGAVGSYAIPDSVTDIKSYAFYTCTKLTDVTIPNSVSNIGAGVFQSCTSLASVAIPNSVTNIGIYAFSGCSRLADVTIGNSVNSIGGYTFAGCTSLRSFTIPNSVAGIANGVFSGCTSLTNATIGTNVASVGSSAFASCAKLTSVTISSSITNIGLYAFSGCSGLTNVTIGNSVNSIGGNPFAGCTSLPSIMVDANNLCYSSVAGVLFDKRLAALVACPGGLSGSYSISNSVSSIGDSAFSYCTNLTGIMIPDSVTNIGDYAFYECSSLTNVTIGNSVKSLGDAAFEGCSSLTSITIPKSVTSMGGYALWCYSLTSVYCEGNAPRIPPGYESSVISGNNSIVYYLPGTIGWSSSFGGSSTKFWLLPYPLILDHDPGFGVLSNRFGFTISWATNRSVVVEASTNLVNPAWQPIRTNNLISFLGTNYFSDSQWTNYPSRFYRIRSR